jgi:hypothetical protein
MEASLPCRDRLRPTLHKALVARSRLAARPDVGKLLVQWQAVVIHPDTPGGRARGGGGSEDAVSTAQ